MTISKSPKFVYVNIWHKTNILVSLRKPTNKKNTQQNKMVHCSNNKGRAGSYTQYN